MAMPSGPAVAIPISVPSTTRNMLAPTCSIRVPSLIDSSAAVPTAPTDGKTRGSIWNTGTAIAQTSTSASSGATNTAAPTAEATPRNAHLGYAF